ncbi:MAG: hypothetical protein MJ191_06205 [Clostridium sp.]|nr:hypothetical protein [Clostridium sp.]
MKKLLITFLIGITCTTVFLPPLHSVALCRNISTISAPASKDSYKNRATVHIQDLKDEFSILTSSGIDNVDFLTSEIAVLRTAIYISALIQSYIDNEQLIDLASEIVQENSGIMRESRILKDKLCGAEKPNTNNSENYIKEAKEITNTLFTNLDKINSDESDSLSYINQVQYLIEASKSLANLINKSTKDSIIKEISQDIINNADNNLETITEIKPVLK